uniref:LAGLIDADG homing endonuclease n=1 Tax=Rhizoctonia solani TaxID=456999 RepID=A0A8E8GRV8_9AGAM|nr:LAGLIDADG homing endonuclease [Rhizoctonia solani]
MYGELFTKFLSVLNLIYSVAGELANFDWDLFFAPFILLCSTLPIKPKPDDSLPKKRLTKLERQQFKLEENLTEVLFGSLLGDLFIQKDKLHPNRNSRLRFSQSIAHKDYIYHLFELFKSYCGSGPTIINQLPDKRTGNVSTAIFFVTYSLPCFNFLHEMFYPEGKKIVPLNVQSLLTPTSLGYWICDDGSLCKTSGRLTICTDSFTLDEVNLLANTLNEKWNLECYINKTSNGGFRIIIPKRSLPILQNLLNPIMPSMMLHKIGL